MAKILCLFCFSLVGLALPSPTVDKETNEIATIPAKSTQKSELVQCHVMLQDGLIRKETGFIRAPQVMILRRSTELMLYDEEVARSLLDKWNKLKAKWMEMVEVGKQKLVGIKNQGVKTFQVAMEKLAIIKDKGLELIHQAQRTYKEIVHEGKIVYVEFKELFEVVKDAYEDLKVIGKEFLIDAQEILSELKTSVAEVELLVKVSRAVGSAVIG
ncbi:hypothetical protein QAD02_003908 [Eretmocerus hayati]|uniref:Uncharacterized protein n=1 Tax=Eretmocerus hayati TaxID=131215 RepID=A0ACC2NQR3_9HYME|nr:hypothetical protein QAD02_003908 [Eretmocerus hayati]